MGFFDFLSGKKPYPPEQKAEVNRLIEELIKIGKQDDYLSERPGGPFNSQCRHIRARDIGRRLNEIGNLDLMELAFKQVKKKLGVNLSSHLEYAWTDIGKWLS
jgi:hypothetical protein